MAPPSPSDRRAPVIHPGSPPPRSGTPRSGTPKSGGSDSGGPTSGAGDSGSGGSGNAGGPWWKRRGVIIGAGVLALIVVVGIAVLVLAGGDSASGPKASTSVDLPPGTATVESAGGPIPFPADARDQILQTVSAYVDAATVKPLRTAKVDPTALAAVFEPVAATKLTGPDRAVLVDEGLPKATGAVKVKSLAPVNLTALAGGDGKLVVVSVDVDLQSSSATAKGLVHIARKGSLVLGQDQAGAWKIIGWTLNVDRSGPGVPVDPAATTTTTKAASK